MHTVLGEVVSEGSEHTARIEDTASIMNAEIIGSPRAADEERATASLDGPVIASADAAAPPAVPFDPSDLDQERARMIRAAGIDLVDMLKQAAAATMRALTSHDLEHALRGADQAYRLAGVYSGKTGEARNGKVEVKVNVAAFAQPRQ